MIGRVFGSFRVTEELGRGGMGVVYGAEHELLGKPAAIKVLLAELSANQTLVDRFFQEAKATSSIDHPGIVEVYDFGHADDGVAYIVMELLKGESLRTRIKREGKLDSHQALRIIVQLSSALEAAHDRGIVHRDLKPANLFLVPDPDIDGGERVRVLDFGVAKLTRGESVAETESGVLMGTPVYMAPEQCSGAAKVDHRADLYAVGCILYEAVCGRRPFVAKGRGDLLAMHMFDTPAPPSSVTALTPSLERLILKLLEKEPRDRVSSAVELARLAKETLQLSQSEKPTSRPPDPALGGATLHTAQTRDIVRGSTTAPAPADRHPRFVLAVAATVIAVVAASVWWMRDGDKGTQAPPMATTSADASPTAVPDGGREPASVSGAVDTRWIRVTAPASGTRVRLGVTGSGRSPIPPSVSGLRPAHQAHAPDYSFELQQHEVTWRQLDTWREKNPTATVYAPAWSPTAPAQRSSYPATGIPWDVAYAYCRSLGANLPTEEEWEYAARGPTRRRYSWGDKRIDLARTRAYAGDNGRTHAVTAYDQDRTPGPPSKAIWGLLSNAREWTASLWRGDTPGGNESWVQAPGSVYRVVRGLPLGSPPPTELPREGGAFRDALCAAAGCLKGRESGLQYIGFRCARRVVATSPDRR